MNVEPQNVQCRRKTNTSAFEIPCSIFDIQYISTLNAIDYPYRCQKNSNTKTLEHSNTYRTYRETFGINCIACVVKSIRIWSIHGLMSSRIRAMVRILGM